VEEENRIRSRVREAIDPVAPPAPWLPDQVIAAIREEAASGRGPGRKRRMAAQRHQVVLLAAGGMAALLVIAVVATLLLGSRLAAPSHVTPAAGPAVDPAVASYQAMVNRDMGSHWTYSICVDTLTPDACRAVNERTRATVQQFNDDLTNAPVPLVLSRSNADMKTGTTQILIDLAAVQAAVDSGDQVKAMEAKNAAVDADFRIVQPAIGKVHCYPRPAAERGIDITRGPYPCK
jgi:hypothetical protein